MKSWLSSLIIAAAAAIAPAKSMLITCLLLIVLDWATGVWAAKKTAKPITSAGFRRTLSKIFIFEIAVLVGFLVQTYLLANTIPISNIIAGFVGMTELLSIMENLNRASGNNLLKALIDKLGSENQPKS